MAILLPQRLQQQPQGVVGIDWANPMSRGLIGAFLPGMPVNVVDGVAMYADYFPPTVTARASSGGRALKGGMYTYQPPSVTYPYGSRFDLTTGSALIVASQDSEQNGNIGIGRAATSGSQNWGVGLHSGSVDGAYGIWGTFAPTPTNNGSTLQKRTVAITADGTTATLYYDANVVASGAYTMTTYDSAFRNRCFGFGGSDVGQDTSTATIATSVGFVWNRALGAGEVTRLTANPWQLFQPQRRRMFTVISGITIRPSSDITTTGWTAYPDPPLYAKIDEASPNDADYIISPSLSASPGPAVFGLNQSAPAGSYTINIRVKYTLSGGQFRVSLLDSGGTSVGTSAWTSATGSFTTYPIALTTTGTATQVKIEVQ